MAVVGENLVVLRPLGPTPTPRNTLPKGLTFFLFTLSYGRFICRLFVVNAS